MNLGKGLKKVYFAQALSVIAIIIDLVVSVFFGMGDKSTATIIVGFVALVVGLASVILMFVGIFSIKGANEEYNSAAVVMVFNVVFIIVLTVSSAIS